MTEQIICEECGGKGTITVDQWQGWQYGPQIACCEKCNGTGRVEKSDFSEQDLQDLEEIGAMKPRLLHILQEHICTHYYIEAEFDGAKMYGWWMDGDSVDDIKWAAQPEAE